MTYPEALHQMTIAIAPEMIRQNPVLDEENLAIKVVSVADKIIQISAEYIEGTYGKEHIEKFSFLPTK